MLDSNITTRQNSIFLDSTIGILPACKISSLHQFIRHDVTTFVAVVALEFHYEESYI
jgi:hypothetical protein